MIPTIHIACLHVYRATAQTFAAAQYSLGLQVHPCTISELNSCVDAVFDAVRKSTTVEMRRESRLVLAAAHFECLDFAVKAMVGIDGEALSKMCKPKDFAGADSVGYSIECWWCGQAMDASQAVFDLCGLAGLVSRMSHHRYAVMSLVGVSYAHSVGTHMHMHVICGCHSAPGGSDPGECLDPGHSHGQDLLPPQWGLKQ